MHYIGIDLGGTNIAAGLVDEDFNLIRKDSVPTKSGRTDREIVSDMSYVCKKLLTDEGLDASQIKSIGIGSPGSIDRENGVLCYSANLPFDYTPMRKWINDEIDVPVYIDNDANCAALGEAYAGATKDADTSLMITIGTGIGGGIIIDKKIYSGCNGAAGELGHSIIVLDGEQCNCGRKGCWEAYGSATALIKQTIAAAMANPESKLYSMIEGKPENVNGKTSFDAMRAGCPVGKGVVDAYIRYFSAGLADMVNIFQPEIIVIGGGVSKEGDTLLKPVAEYLKEWTYKGVDKRTVLKRAVLGNDAGIIGAAALGI